MTTRTLLAVTVGSLALVVSSTGGAVAGSMITGAQIKDGTVTSADLKDKTIKAGDLAPATITQLRGVSGPAGATGATGATGPAGPVGPKGATGSTGSQGAPGAQGAPGMAGAPGAPGAPGPANLVYAGTGVFSITIGAGVCGSTTTSTTAAIGDTYLIVPDYGGTYPAGVLINPGVVKTANVLPFAVCNVGTSSANLPNVTYSFWRIKAS